MYEPFINHFFLTHLKEWIMVGFLCAALVLILTGCNKDNTDENVFTADTPSVVSVNKDETTAPEAIDTPDTPDSPDTAEKKTPYDYPYEIDQIKEDLIAYGESLELYYYESMTMKQANSVVKIQTRLAENGKTLERWCKNDIDSIVAQAVYRNIELDDVEFNITITESPTYKGEYTITIISQND